MNTTTTELVRLNSISECIPALQYTQVNDVTHPQEYNIHYSHYKYKHFHLFIYTHGILQQTRKRNSKIFVTFHLPPIDGEHTRVREGGSEGERKRKRRQEEKWRGRARRKEGREDGEVARSQDREFIRKGERERGREGGREGESEGGREGGREREREREREGGREGFIQRGYKFN